MSKLRVLFVLGCCVTFVTLNGQNPQRTRLTIHVQGIKSPKGSINIALYKSDADFKQERFAYVQRIRANSNGVAIIDNVDYGTYGVAVYHDENENFRLDRTFLGMPSEGYGFSNDARGSFGPPEFKQVSVALNQSKTEIRMQLSY
ncbi:MAG: DUF2141 domain-containing protein [Leptospirales bacterium]|nr:DUF2141 domain-containing protein [Leptospirales bacterium]